MKNFASVPNLAGTILIATAFIAQPMQSIAQPALAAADVLAQASPQPAQNDAYAPLRSYLAAKNWRAADQETRRLIDQWIAPAGGVSYSVSLTSNIPVDALQTLDRLWLEASNGRFGFSVQQRIWQEVAAQTPNNREAAVRAFGRRVDWLRPVPDGNNFTSPDWFTQPELTYTLNAPAGHFPWLGVNQSIIQNILGSESCGSCTIDAMYLQNDRFFAYIPALYDRVRVALSTPAQPEPQAWRTLRSRFEINLNSLYPTNRCPVQTIDQAISPNSQILAVSSYSYERACGGTANSNSTLALWNAQRGTRIITLMRGLATEASSYRGQAQEPPTEQTRIVGDVANAIAFTPDSRLIAAGMSDGTVRLWDTATGRLVRTLSGHRYAVRAIAISSDGTKLVSASSDQTLRVWNLQTGQLTRTVNLGPADGIVHTVQINPVGSRMAIATSYNNLQLRDLSTGQLIRTFVAETSAQPNRLPFSFSRDGRFIATGDRDRSVKVWHADSGARIITLQGHQGDITQLAFSPDSSTLASSDANYAIRLWNLQTYQLQRTLDAAAQTGPNRPQSPGYLSFTADGRILASSALVSLRHPVTGEPLSQPGATLWTVATGQPIANVNHATQFSFSPNSQFLLTNGQTLQVWQP